jgi:hypothetical protein
MRIRNIVLVAIWISAGTLFGAPVPITIVVFDHGETSDGTLYRAVETARLTFRRAGVSTNWSVCRVSKNLDEHCILPSEGSYLKVIVVPDWAGPMDGREALGRALTRSGRQGVLSYVLANPAKTLAGNTGQPLAVVLGCVMAHCWFSVKWSACALR